MVGDEQQAQYKTSRMTSGNSQGIRIPAKFLKDYPDFNKDQEVVIKPISSHLALISLVSQENDEQIGDEHIDPTLEIFLAFLERDLSDNPQHLQQLSKEELDNVAELVKDVERDEAE